MKTSVHHSLRVTPGVLSQLQSMLANACAISFIPHLNKRALPGHIIYINTYIHKRSVYALTLVFKKSKTLFTQKFANENFYSCSKNL